MPISETKDYSKTTLSLQQLLKNSPGTAWFQGKFLGDVWFVNCKINEIYLCNDVKFYNG